MLLDAVERVRPVLEAHADEAEAIATLPKATVDALVASGLLRLKLPAVLGGAEADPVTQIEVIEAVSRIDPSVGWCLMVGATTIGMPGAFLPDEAVAVIFAGGRVPTAAGVFMPGGESMPVEGSYRVSGRWSFASGVRYAEWVGASTLISGDPREPRPRLKVVMPVAAVQIHDTWQVAGLKGTGSCDFSATDVFVPAAFGWEIDRARARRGGPLYRLGLPAFVVNEHAAFALGVARRALDEITELARSKRRGLSRPSLVAARGSVQRTLGECEMRLRAARALVRELNEQAWTIVSQGSRRLEPTLQAELRAVATLATEVALDIVSRAFRAAGGDALYQSSVLQRCLRDLHAGAQHFMVSDSAYESLAQFRLGRPDANPMG